MVDWYKPALCKKNKKGVETMKRNKVKRILSTATAMALTTTTLAGGMTVAASEGTSVPAFEDIEFPDDAGKPHTGRGWLL